jgi:N-acetylneuraminate synthase
MGIGVAVASVAVGATVIEKHFTLDRSDGGVDSTFSMEPKEMAALRIETDRAWKALGSVVFGPSEKEKKSLQFRRSIYIVEDMKAGDTITEENMRAIRPGLGLPTKYYDVVLGKKVSRDVARGTAVCWDLFN